VKRDEETSPLAATVMDGRASNPSESNDEHEDSDGNKTHSIPCDASSNRRQEHDLE
jgi:hypothetical protein